MQVDAHEAEKVSDHRFRRRPEPGAQRRAPNQFGGQAFAEAGVARSARRYWRRQKNQEFVRSRWRKCQEEAANAAPSEGRSREPECSREVARGLRQGTQCVGRPAGRWQARWRRFLADDGAQKNSSPIINGDRRRLEPRSRPPRPPRAQQDLHLAPVDSHRPRETALGRARLAWLLRRGIRRFTIKIWQICDFLVLNEL